MRLTQLSNLIAALALAGLVALLGLGFRHRLSSYQGQRQVECLFGSDEVAQRTCPWR